MHNADERNKTESDIPLEYHIFSFFWQETNHCCMCGSTSVMWWASDTEVPHFGHWPQIKCPQVTPSELVSSHAVVQPADLCSPNLSLINYWHSFWQLFALKPSTFDKFYKDENLAKGLFCQLKHFIHNCHKGLSRAHEVPIAVWISRMKRKNVKPSEVIPSITGKANSYISHLNTWPESRHTCKKGISPFSPWAII